MFGCPSCLLFSYAIFIRCIFQMPCMLRSVLLLITLVAVGTCIKTFNAFNDTVKHIGGGLEFFICFQKDILINLLMSFGKTVRLVAYYDYLMCSIHSIQHLSVSHLINTVAA